LYIQQSYKFFLKLKIVPVLSCLFSILLKTLNILFYLDIISLKCCISSLELLDSDIVPAIIEFYLDPTSIVKKTFLKLLIKHWVCEICEIQNLLNKIVDPFAFTQVRFKTNS
jgi:hypothetical protein